MRTPIRHRILQAVGLVSGLAVLASVFALYTRPAFLVTVIDQMWSCF